MEKKKSAHASGPLCDLRRWTAGARLIAATLSIVACGACGSTDSESVRADSSRRGFAEPGAMLDTLSSAPVVSIGGADVTGPAQFAGVSSVWVAGDGAVWVADTQSQEIRVFGPDGAHRMTLGGRGDGPGEFQQVRLVRTPDPDVLAAIDGRAGRVTTYAASGEILGIDRWVAQTLVRPLGIGESGEVIGATEPGIPISSFDDGTYQDSMRVLAWNDLEGSPDTIARAPGLKFAMAMDLARRMPLTAHPGISVRGADLLVAHPHRFRIDVIRAGSVVDSIGVVRAPRPVYRAIVDEAADFRREHFSERAATASISLLDHPDLPDTLPGYDKIVVTGDGGVWARPWRVDRYATAIWDRFDRSGEFLGRVVTPPDFELHAVAGDRVTGVRRDEFGVEYLELYEFPAG